MEEQRKQALKAQQKKADSLSPQLHIPLDTIQTDTISL